MGWGGFAGRLLQPVRQAMAKAQPVQKQRTIVRKTEKVGGGGAGGGEDGSGRVLMTIELELTRINGEEGPAGEAGTGRSKFPGMLSRLANQLTFK